MFRADFVNFTLKILHVSPNLPRGKKGILLSKNVLASSFYVYSFFMPFFQNVYSSYRTFQVRYYITPSPQLAAAV